MSGITSWFTKNPVAANLLAILVMVGGVFTLSGIRIEGFPKIPPSYITVEIAYPGANATQVDDGVSRKVEKALEGVAGVKKILSLSHEGSAEIMVEKESGYDMMRLLNDVKTRVEGVASFPEKAEKPIINVDEFKDFVLLVQVYGNVDERTLQTSARLVEEALQADPKISKIESFGKKSSEIRIEVESERLKAYGVSFEQVRELISQNSIEYGFGKLRSSQSLITLRSDSKLKNYEDFINLPLLTLQDGATVYLKDVAEVVDGYEESDSKALYQGMDSVGIVLFTGSKGHLLEVSKAAYKVVEKLRTQLPEEIQLDIWADYSIYMKNRLTLLQSNAWQGLLIVFVILALFLDLKLAFWVAAGIPFSIAGTIALMGDSFLGYSLNDVTTFGIIIVLGILVDDAIVVSESVFEQRQICSDPVEGTVRGVHKVAVATIFGTLTTIAAFYPLLLIKNDLGKILASFSVVVIVALIFSLVESELVLPAHLASISIEKGEPKNIFSRVLTKLQGGASCCLDCFNLKIYRPLLGFALNYRYCALVILMTLTLAGGWLLKMGYVRSVFFPDIPSDVINIELFMENGSSSKMTYKNAHLLEKAAEESNKELMEKYNTDAPPITRVMAAVVGSDKIEIYAELQLQEKRAVDTVELLKMWREKADNLEGVQHIEFNGNTETGGGFTIKVESRNVDSLEVAVKRVKRSLDKIAGVDDVRDDLEAGEPEIRLKLKPEARHLGLTPAALALQIGSAYGGFEVDRFQRDTDEVKLNLIYGRFQREYIYQLLESTVTLEDGSTVPLKSVAQIESTFSSGFIRRENSKRAIEVKAALDKEVISAEKVFKELEEGVIKELADEYPDVEISAGGELEEEEEMKDGLVKAMIMILLLIYALLAVPLKSYWKPFIIMSVIPFGLTGAVVGHLIVGVPLSLLSFFGMLALTGIVVNDSLLMVTTFNDLIDEGYSVEEALVRAGTSRLRAIFLTTATTVCGLMPLIFATSEQAQYLIPAAVSLAYGEIFATLITLLLIPILMHMAYDIKRLSGACFELLALH